MKISTTALTAFVLVTHSTPATAAVRGSSEMGVQEDHYSSHYAPWPSHSGVSHGTSCGCRGGGEKYFVPSYEVKSWLEHLIAARAMGCELASIHSLAENFEAYSVVDVARLPTIVDPYRGEVWIGGYRNAYGDPSEEDHGGRTGLHKPGEDGGWKWSDESYWNYFNWNSPGGNLEQPNGPFQDITDIQNAVVMNMVAGAGVGTNVLGEWEDKASYSENPAIYQCCIKDTCLKPGLPEVLEEEDEED